MGENRHEEQMDPFEDPSESSPFAETQQYSGDTGPRPTSAELPDSIGRYRIDGLLGEGGFGSVYLGFDDELQRRVAVKVPHKHRLQTQEDVEEFLREARTLASLEHPGVVPVHDVGHTDDGLCYVVSRFIDGTDLAERIKESPVPIGETIELMRAAAEALHYVHTRGVIHRDIKPGNILLDKRGRPFLADFGLALREEDFVGYGDVAGTPSYMSPEQARGESHLIDGRSDIFSLGVVLYVMLTSQLPFKDADVVSLLERIQFEPPIDPRQIDRNIPRELERICLKSMSKRAVDRYETALDLAEELKLVSDVGGHLTKVHAPRTVAFSDSLELTGVRGGVVPKGLRSFDEGDADFFLNLLPGPRGRDNLPDSIRFWKRRVDERDSMESFRIGVIYGPSGCGKSSFVKAGLIPQLDANVIPVLVEAAQGATESQLLNRLRRKCSYLSTDLDLRGAMTELRKGRVMGAGKKVLIVIDQFEQWLYSPSNRQQSELGLALRQCDGEHLQCILLLRDDFWLSLTRFMSDLEIELVQNRNMLLVDLFDRSHARKVLAEFGTAFEKLPFREKEQTRTQAAFLDQAIDGLAEGDKITPVRLALFAEMLKGRPWSAATLRQIGGIERVGVLFLDECFTAAHAPPEYIQNLPAVQATLKQLLPDSSANIKGTMKSRAELMRASECEGRPEVFGTVLRILDADLRLITPSESTGEIEDSETTSGGPHFQLTHDFLVPTLREWLDRYQRESRRGRAEILLKERAEIWSKKRESRQLPTRTEWGSIYALTRKRTWNESQTAMMRVATRRYVTQAALALGILLLGIWGSREWQGQTTTGSQINQLERADVSRVPELLDALTENERWAVPRLRALASSAADEDAPTLFISLALLRHDTSVLNEVVAAIPDAKNDQLILLRDELLPHADIVTADLWEQAASETATSGQKLNSILILASFDPPTDDRKDPPWNSHSEFLAEKLIEIANGDRDFYKPAVELVHPARSAVLDHLLPVFSDRKSSDARSQAASNLVRDLLKDDPRELTRQFLNGTPEQFQKVLEIVDENRDLLRPVLAEAARATFDSIQNPEERINPASRKSLAAAALLRYGWQDGVWDIFKDTLPDARCYFIHRLQDLNVSSDLIAHRLLKENDPVVLSGLLQCVGTFSPDSLHSDTYLEILERAKTLYLTCPDSSVHASIHWLFSQWGHTDWLSSANSGLQSTSITDSQWYVNQHDHTMIRLETSAGRYELAMAETTVKQFEAFMRESSSFDPTTWRRTSHTPSPDCPITGVNFRGATSYCNWLTLAEGMGVDQLCYTEPTDEKPYAELVPDYAARKGYRLPTVEEWRAAHSGNRLSYLYFPSDQDIIRKYMICEPDSQNRTWPFGKVKPNGFGLFDMAGSVQEWASDADEDGQRSCCGTSYKKRAFLLEEENWKVQTVFISPGTTFTFIGFRIARSQLPVEFQ